MYKQVSLVAIAALLMFATAARADTVSIDLEYNNAALEWQLFAQVLDTGGGADGGNGLAAVRALVDNIDYASTTIASGIGAVSVLDPGGQFERPAVLPTVGGTLDIIYGQDPTNPGAIVTGVGVGGRWLIASGGFASPAAPPAFGDDDFGQTTNGNFLNAASGGAGPASRWDGVTLRVLDVTPAGLPGDYNDDGLVDAADYAAWRTAVGQPAGSLPNDYSGTTIGAGQLAAWKANYGATMTQASAAVAAPEPACLSIVFVGLVAVAARRSPRRLPS
ncbi:hypothetical protein Pla123a_16370 [Posidoniimonas polymericola]|uniref:PEP-CTERM protein-sorting domain-containing protein n=1 Tax=Posidoniimonas polymericola TaxID=2528002 RepID=A0A5C5YSR4_9BACT|nr:hypothetical protein [Posidoniimonas polymericola]TWT77841.1 hypothetical protein Pla123a_16370 [Posidoniimonas polymericola]